ncbi:hypothetical protein SS50377_20517 [Spironucleus salmonicida]|uniref:Uncharacterized protein n=1 Tax=Spironucleus salmonicida TaxID=348837 RepID=V6LSP5_9EUKA|nr:hypothetical protein SS50377_20517 [Spironucleus salmonicida]|eukprot:EST43809.1 Hypothetical protein SS50377_16429 [Spironucleus salmonicida]
MENSNPQPDYDDILNNYPFEQVQGHFIPYFDILLNPNINNDNAQYQQIRAQVLADLVIYFTELYEEQQICQISSLSCSVIKGEQQHDAQVNQELVEIRLRNALLETIVKEVDKDTFDAGVIKATLSGKIQPGKSCTDAVVDLVLENRCLESENEKLRQMVNQLQLQLHKGI